MNPPWKTLKTTHLHHDISICDNIKLVNQLLKIIESLLRLRHCLRCWEYIAVMDCQYIIGLIEVKNDKGVLVASIKKWLPAHSQKERQYEKADGYVPDEGRR